MKTEQAVKEYFESYLVGVYTCSRVWEAWSSNTMTQDDFQEAKENDEFFDDFIQGVLNFHDQQLRLKVDEMKASQQENEIEMMNEIEHLKGGIALMQINIDNKNDELDKLSNPLDVKIDSKGNVLSEPKCTCNCLGSEHDCEQEAYKLAQTISERLQSDKEKINEYIDYVETLKSTYNYVNNENLDTINTLQAKVQELEEENKRLYERDCNATVQLCYATKDNPFKREDLQIVDVGVSDNIYIVESKVLTQSRVEVERLTDLLKNISNNIGKGSLNIGDCQVKIMKHLNK